MLRPCTAPSRLSGGGRRIAPAPADRRRPKAMLDVGGVPLARRALESLRAAGVRGVVAVTGHCASAFDAVRDLLSGERFNDRFAEHGNVYSLWCARDVVRERLLHRELRRAVRGRDRAAAGAARGIGRAVRGRPWRGRGVDEGGCGRRAARVTSASGRPCGPHPEYIGLTRIDPAHGELLARTLEDFVRRGTLDVYYEDALAELAAQVPVRTVRGGRARLDRDRRPRGPRACPRRGAGARERRLEGPAVLAPLHGAAALPARRARARGAGAALGEVTAELGFETVGVVSGATYTAALGADLATALPAVSPEPVRVEANTQAEVDRVAGVGRCARRTRSSRSGAARRSTSRSPPARAPICR